METKISIPRCAYCGQTEGVRVRTPGGDLMREGAKPLPVCPDHVEAIL